MYMYFAYQFSLRVSREFVFPSRKTWRETTPAVYFANDQNLLGAVRAIIHGTFFFFNSRIVQENAIALLATARWYVCCSGAKAGGRLKHIFYGNDIQLNIFTKGLQATRLGHDKLTSAPRNVALRKKHTPAIYHLNGQCSETDRPVTAVIVTFPARSFKKQFPL